MGVYESILSNCVKLKRPNTNSPNTIGMFRYNKISKNLLDSLFSVSDFEYWTLESTSFKINSKIGMKKKVYIRVV